MTTSYLRGHKIEFINNEFIYSDNKESTINTHKDRPCGNCGQHETKEGHDACLGTLPGLMNACCGHGVESEAYVQLLDGSCIRGEHAIAIINILKEDLTNEITFIGGAELITDIDPLHVGDPTEILQVKERLRNNKDGVLFSAITDWTNPKFED